MLATFTYVLPYHFSSAEWEGVRNVIVATIPEHTAYELWAHADAYGTEVTVRVECGEGADGLNLRIREAIVNC